MHMKRSPINKYQKPIYLFPWYTYYIKCFLTASTELVLHHVHFLYNNPGIYHNCNVEENKFMNVRTCKYIFWDKPKSAIFTTMLSLTKQFLVARSLCTNFLSERYTIPDTICIAIWTRSTWVNCASLNVSRFRSSVSKVCTI